MKMLLHGLERYPDLRGSAVISIKLHASLGYMMLFDKAGRLHFKLYVVAHLRKNQ